MSLIFCLKVLFVVLLGIHSLAKNLETEDAHSLSGHIGVNEKAGNWKDLQPEAIQLPKSSRYPFGANVKYNTYRLSNRVKAIQGEMGFPIGQHRYYLSIISMFKNERGAMKEWLEHHIGHGVEHFYLIDDGSTDSVLDILNPYIASGHVEMLPTTPKSIPFRQSGVYKKIYTNIVAKNESKWVAIIDLDEFLYSPYEVDIRNVLRDHEDLSLVGVNWVWYGSNNLIDQPKSIIQSFTHRADMKYEKYPELVDHYKILTKSHTHHNDWQKYILNTNHQVDNIDVHNVWIEGVCDNLSYNRYPKKPPLLLNHYSIQSRQFFLKNKASRGDVNNWVDTDARDHHWFHICDINDVFDDRLAEQNRKYDIAMNLEDNNVVAKNPLTPEEESEKEVYVGGINIEPDEPAPIEGSKSLPIKEPGTDTLTPDKKVKKEESREEAKLFKDHFMNGLDAPSIA